MQSPPVISFRNVPHSGAVEAAVHERIDKLETFFDRITHCTVVIDEPHRHQHQGPLFRVHVNIAVPGDLIVVGREHHDEHAHEDVYVAVRDAFDAAERRLEDHVRRMRGQVKHHAPSLWHKGRVSELTPTEDHGTITTDTGQTVYFHRNSVLHNGFGHLEIDRPVKLQIEEGEKGPQASAVRVLARSRSNAADPIASD